MRKESVTASLSEILKKELDILKQKSGIDMDFKVLWIPKTDSAKEGEVIGNTIYIYSTNITDAVDTLRHEFFDAMISNSVSKPYLDLINALLSVISERAYQGKEEVVESLVRMMKNQYPVYSSSDDFSPEEDLATA